MTFLVNFIYFYLKFKKLFNLKINFQLNNFLKLYFFTLYWIITYVSNCSFSKIKRLFNLKIIFELNNFLKYYFSFVYIIYLSNIFCIFDVQGYWYILARKLLILYIINFCYLNNVCDMRSVKSVNLIKLNKRLQLHHFNELVGGNEYSNFFVCIDLIFIDKYLYLIFNVF